MTEGVARCLLIIVREMEWNADDADLADLHCETPCYTVKPCGAYFVDS